MVPGTNTPARSARRKRPLLALGIVLAGCAGLQLAAKSRSFTPQATPAPQNQIAEYQAAVPKTIVELQQFRQASSSRIEPPNGVQGIATLINLNPEINVWYLLKVARQDGSQSSYHLENPKPRSRKLVLDPNDPAGIEILEGNARHPCNLFAGKPASVLDQARSAQLPYAPLCDGQLFLRNPVKGHRTKLEAGAEFFRNQVWGGEQVTVIFHHLLEDTHRETAELQSGGGPSGAAGVRSETEGAPLAAAIDPQYAGRVLTPAGLGLTLDVGRAPIKPGAWYSPSGNPGIYVSVLEPQFIDKAILQNRQAAVNALDTTEASSLCYLVAFDLDQFNLAYSLGTEHPSVEWSEHIQPAMKDPKLPGPDGIGTISPLVSTGVISPEDGRRTVAAFTGGFKREHGAFKFGALAMENHGSHYGFVENGVVFSKLQPGLATIFVLDDGSVQMKTWDAQDDHLLAKIKYARQNGVPLVEFDDRSQSTVPGQFVNKWGPGNWSGSEDMKLRTIRSGAALQWNGRKRFLIYAVFSDATPSAMARVFQAYHCRYGMPMDMNALEHTYCALYRRSGSQFLVDYLLEGMNEVDKTDSGGTIPRFLGYADNRDFFYVMRRNP